MNEDMKDKFEKLADIFLKQNEALLVNEEINSLTGEDQSFLPMQFKRKPDYHRLKWFDNYRDFLEWQDEMIDKHSEEFHILNLRYDGSDIEVYFITTNKELK